MTAWLICGDRHYSDYDHFCYIATKHVEPNDTIISGEAPGADTLAKRYSQDNNLPYEGFPAQWSKFGRAAGPIRNKEMKERLLQFAKRGAIAFLAEGSKGTANMLSQLKDCDVKIIVEPVTR